MKRITFLLFSGLLLLTSACGPDNATPEENPTPVNFDRRAMLTNWSEEVITPAYRNIYSELGLLDFARDNYMVEPSAEHFAALKLAFDNVYLKWQGLSPFLFGKAEEIRLRGRMNTYPTNESLIEENINDPFSVNFDLPSQTAAQGLPALDYLLYGPEAATRFTDEKYRLYLSLLIDQMISLTHNAYMDWEASTEAFVQNDGNSATASIDRMVNDYIFHYEKFLRAGKVGIPAGVFSDTPLPDRTEAHYSGNSKALYLAALAASKAFFSEHGLAQYLDALNVMRDGELLSTKINNQFSAIEGAAQPVGLDFAEQILTDNSKMLRLYDEMQRLVVLLKVDMLQALSINVDYVDADGD